MSRKHLERVMSDRAFVTVLRRKGWEETDGFVVAVDRDWFAMVRLENAAFGGVAVLRVDDVRAVLPHEHPALGKRVLKSQGLWPPAVSDVLDLTDARSVAFTSGSLCRVLSFAREKTRPGTSWVGGTARITKKRVHAREVSPSARWADDVGIRLRDLTKVVLWDPYVENLTAIADAHEGNPWATAQPKRRSS